MSNLCTANLPAGVNAECLVFPSPIKNIAIADGDHSFATIDAFVSWESWRDAIQDHLTMYVPADLAGYEVTTDDPTIATSSFGKKIVTRNGIPSMIAYLEGNPCEYNELMANFKGGTYRIYFILEDGSIVGSLQTDGTVIGFKARVTAMGKGVPVLDAVDQAYRLYINFVVGTEFDTRYFDKPAWNPLNQIPLVTPIGLSLIPKSTYGLVTGDISVHICERCGDPVTTIVTADFEVIEYSATAAPTVVCAAGTGSGNYTLTVEKPTTTPMIAGEWALIRVKHVASAIVEMVSGKLLVKG